MRVITVCLTFFRFTETQKTLVFTINLMFDLQ